MKEDTAWVEALVFLAAYIERTCDAGGIRFSYWSGAYDHQKWAVELWESSAAIENGEPITTEKESPTWQESLTTLTQKIRQSG